MKFALLVKATHARIGRLRPSKKSNCFKVLYALQDFVISGPLKVPRIFSVLFQLSG